MPFVKGHKKFGGKSKGCKNKINRDVVGLLDSLGCNPIEGLARIASDQKASLELQAHCHAQLAKYVHPQLKSIELTGPGGGAIQHEHMDAGAELLSRVAGIAARRGPGGSDKGSQSGATKEPAA